MEGGRLGETVAYPLTLNPAGSGVREEHHFVAEGLQRIVDRPSEGDPLLPGTEGALMFEDMAGVHKLDRELIRVVVALLPGEQVR